MKVTMIGRCGAYPTAGEATTGFLLQTDSHSYLIDCGAGVVERMQRYVPLRDLDAVFISHYHWDHVSDLGVLQYGAMLTQKSGVRKRPLGMYLPTADSASYQRYSFTPWCKSIPIDAGSTLSLGDLRVSFLATRHPVPCLAMRFESQGKSVCFSGDSSYIPQLAEFAQRADLFICEANYYADEDGSVTHHLTSDEVGRISRDAEVASVILSHLPPYGDLDQLREQVCVHYNGDVSLSSTGLTVLV